MFFFLKKKQDYKKTSTKPPEEISQQPLTEINQSKCIRNFF